MKCPHCKGEHPEDYEFCPKTGKKINVSVNLECRNEFDHPIEIISGNRNGHDFVDLGLPSGVMWATCNIGANNIKEPGDYYA